MARSHDNWERLVAATLRREQLWKMFHDHSRSPSISSLSSDFSLASPLHLDVPFGLRQSISYYSHKRQEPVYIAAPEGIASEGDYGAGFDLDQWHSRVSLELQRIVKAMDFQNIMNAKETGETNQLAAEQIVVNGWPLSSRELVSLQSCPNPPKKLKAGNYWYDKNSGFWGKQGQKPSQIISPHLNVGRPIRTDASNGNTQVYINGREITKVELRMLKLAGVQCAGNPHFWVYDDGSYQKEGQANIKGYIWGKAGTKLLCTVFSLPVPSKSSNPCEEQVNSMNSRSVHEYLEERAMQKLLLIGYSGSGTNTIFKQAKILYKEAPLSEDKWLNCSEDARKNIAALIQSIISGYITVLLEVREHFEAECLDESRKDESSAVRELIGPDNREDEETVYSLSPKLKALANGLLGIMEAGVFELFFPAYCKEFAPLLKELWSSAALQETIKRINDLEVLPSVASYFLLRAADILKPHYRPTDMDILYAEDVTSSSGLASVEFSFPEQPSGEYSDNGNLNDFLLRFRLIRSPGKRHGEDYMWPEAFEDVRLVIFCISLTDYDQFVIDANGYSVNKMLLSKRFFESVIIHPNFKEKDSLLLLNKLDLFEEKIKEIPLNECDWFKGFNPATLLDKHSTLGWKGFHYIAVKFKSLYSAVTGRKLYVLPVNAVEPDSVNAALKYAKEIVIWHEERDSYLWDYREESFSSDEDS